MPTGKCYTADICSGYSLIDCIRKAMKGRIIDCSPHQDIYFLESHSAKNEESNLENLFVSPAGREMLKYKPQTKLKQKTNPNLEFFTSNQNPTMRQLQPVTSQHPSSTTKIDLYEEAAAILGLSCTQTDDCRCIECQCHYFDFEEEIDFPAAGSGSDLNMPVTLVSSATFGKQFIIHFSRSFEGILNRIIEIEKNVMAMNDKDLSKIYDKCTKNMILKSIWYLGMMCLCNLQYNLLPLVIGPIEQQVGNDTILIKRFPMALWFPVDDQEYYLIAYLYKTLNSAMAMSYLTYTDVFVFSLIVFPLGQLQILNYMLENFETYKQKFLNSREIADEEMAAYSVFVENILRHQEIIEYVEYFNAAMSGLMVLDFLQFSLENATICLQAVATTSPLVIFFVCYQLAAMLLRLFMYYYYANEIIVLSNNLSNSIYNSNWYDQPPRTKVLMQIMMIRSQKKLSCTIGPFSDMSLNSMIAIIKATYSYAMLLYNTSS